VRVFAGDNIVGIVVVEGIRCEEVVEETGCEGELNILLFVGEVFHRDVGTLMGRGSQLLRYDRQIEHAIQGSSLKGFFIGTWAL
jgi:hypothetical protein